MKRQTDFQILKDFIEMNRTREESIIPKEVDSQIQALMRIHGENKDDSDIAGILLKFQKSEEVNENLKSKLETLTVIV